MSSTRVEVVGGTPQRVEISDTGGTDRIDVVQPTALAVEVRQGMVGPAGPAGPAGGVPTSRLITAGTRLTGGGDLSADRTLSIADGALNAAALDAATALRLPPTPVTAGQVPTVSGGAYILATPDAVPTARQIIAGSRLTGGGTLAADRTLSIADGALDAASLTAATALRLPPTPAGGTDGHVPTVSGGVYALARPVTEQVAVYATPGSSTWTKPTWAKTIEAHVIQAGAGGGSGRRGAAASVRCGGGGGGAGGYSFATFAASALPATVNVTVAGGSAGGAAVIVDSTNGNAGANPSTSFFGVSTTDNYVRASNPGGGSGGSATAGAGGIGSFALHSGANGAAASTSGGVGAAAGTTNVGAAGGAGGGLTTGDVAAAGGAGGQSLMRYGVLGGTAGAVGVAGGAGAGGLTNSSGSLGLGGGGAGSHASLAGVAGGAGGSPGGGGGGGASSVNGVASGAGGAGGDGRIIIISRG